MKNCKHKDNCTIFKTERCHKDCVMYRTKSSKFIETECPMCKEMSDNGRIICDKCLKKTISFKID